MYNIYMYQQEWYQSQNRWHGSIIEEEIRKYWMRLYQIKQNRFHQRSLALRPQATETTPSGIIHCDPPQNNKARKKRKKKKKQQNHTEKKVKLDVTEGSEHCQKQNDNSISFSESGKETPETGAGSADQSETCLPRNGVEEHISKNEWHDDYERETDFDSDGSCGTKSDHDEIVVLHEKLSIDPVLKKKSSGIMSSNEKKRRLNLKEWFHRQSRLDGELPIPISPMNFLNRIRRGCVYESKKIGEGLYKAEVKISGNVLATGKGESEIHAKHSAAEAAIREIVKSALERIMKTQYSSRGDDELWNGLSSFALYMLFDQWKIKEVEACIDEGEEEVKTGYDLLKHLEDLVFIRKKRRYRYPIIKPRILKELSKCPRMVFGPLQLLKMLRPDLLPSVINKTTRNKVATYTALIKMNQKIFTGVGTSKQIARKKVAKTVLSYLYNVNYKD